MSVSCLENETKFEFGFRNERKAEELDGWRCSLIEDTAASDLRETRVSDDDDGRNPEVDVEHNLWT